MRWVLGLMIAGGVTLYALGLEIGAPLAMVGLVTLVVTLLYTRRGKSPEGTDPSAFPPPMGPLD